MKPNIIVCDHIHEDGLKILEKATDIAYDNLTHLSKTDLSSQLSQAHGIVTRSSTDIDETLLKQAPNLKAIVRAGVGVDNIDIEACSKRGIIVMNVPTSNTIAAVELTMTHILGCVRNFANCNFEFKNQKIWKRENWYGIELKDKTLGVIGFGNIGSKVAIRAKAFDMEIKAYDPYIPASKVTALGMTYATNLEDILTCDIITIHTPKNPETINMITGKEIQKMKDGVILINCARGGLYNENDLYDAIKTKKVAMAGIDVFDKEPATDNRLLDLPNLTATPHVGANTKESQKRVAISAAEQILDAIRGVAYKDALNLPIDENTISASAKPYLAFCQKLGFFLSKLINTPIKLIRLNASGEIGEFAKPLATFCAVGALQKFAENVNHVNAEFIAQEKQVQIEHIGNLNAKSFVNAITLEIVTDTQNMTVKGTLLDGTFERILHINGFEVDINPKGHMILFRNQDVPGVIAKVATILTGHGINIADFRLSRNKGKALAAIMLDEGINETILDELRHIEESLGADYLVL